MVRTSPCPAQGQQTTPNSLHSLFSPHIPTNVSPVSHEGGRKQFIKVVFRPRPADSRGLDCTGGIGNATVQWELQASDFESILFSSFMTFIFHVKFERILHPFSLGSAGSGVCAGVFFFKKKTTWGIRLNQRCKHISAGLGHTAVATNVKNLWN